MTITRGETIKGEPPVPVESLEAPEDPKAALEKCLAEALTFKEEGNAKLRIGTKSSYLEAKDLYSKGVVTLENAAQAVHGAQDKLSEGDRMKGGVLLSTIFSNRAHVRMLLRDFAGCVDDSRRSFSLDPANLKAFWRAAKASIHMELYKNAKEFADCGLGIDPENADLKKISALCESKLEAQKLARRATKENYSAEDASALQEHVSELHEKHAMVSAQLEESKRELQRSAFVKKALESHPDELASYKRLGRCFVRTPKQSLLNELDSHMKELETAAPRLQSSKVDLGSRKEDAEEEFRACLNAFKRKQAAKAE